MSKPYTERLQAAAPKLLAALEHIERACEPGVDQSDDELEAFIANVRRTAQRAIREVMLTERTIRYYIVTGSTWPHQPSMWVSKHKAMRAAAEMRRKLRKGFPITYGVYKRSDCGIVVEERPDPCGLPVSR